jgi:tRNA-dihydrouridine synthase B
MSKPKLDFSKPLVVLAPLAGYTDLPFRWVVKNFGVDLTISEMISSNALVYNSQKTYKMIEKSPNEIPYSVQLAGNSSSIIAKAVNILNNDNSITGIDVNCGCPAPKVFNHGSGSSLLGDLKKLKDILSTVVKESNKEFNSAKIRIGIDEKIPVDIAKVVEDSGMDFISVHGRTKKGAYKAPVDYEAIKNIKQNVSIPVIANGDINSFEKAQWVKEYTNCDGIMIGRGAIGNPWIFYQIRNGSEDISSELKKEIILEHLNAMVKFYGERGTILFRKHLHIYSKGYPEATDFRATINNISDFQDMKKVLGDFF